MAEQAVDLASGALLAVTVQSADRGDTTSYTETLDGGYHSGAVLVNMAQREIRRYVPERGKRHWAGKAEEQRCVYANRRRVMRAELCALL